MSSDCPVTVIIPCAGTAGRWRNHLGTPKHLISIDGERILDRTVRLARKFGADEIHIVTRRQDKRYQVPGATQDVARLDSTMHEVDKYASSRHLWRSNGATRILLGDVYFTEDAMRTIMDPGLEDWTWFCRVGPSKITGHKYGEGFAVGFCDCDRDTYAEAIRTVAKMHSDTVIGRANGWSVARYLAGASGKDVSRHVSHPNFVLIDDETDDFDTPADYTTWMAKCRSSSR